MVDSEIDQFLNDEPNNSGEKGQQDAKPNFLAAQFNLETLSSGGISTRRSIDKIAGEPNSETNTTGGVDAQYVDQYDGRLYFFGGQIKERLYIGGNPGNELSVSAGLGGAFLDIEPGAGHEIPRGYDTEKVDSVTGCCSYFGADTFIDGLYSLTRYGLALTTKVQENQNNLRVNYLSGPIEPIFTDITEGIGLIIASSDKTSGGIYLLPTTGMEVEDRYIKNEDDGHYYPATPDVPIQEVIFETHELSLKNPPTLYLHLCQVEFDFDYVCCPKGLQV
ncbi:unnamed protein product [Cylicocyclus nassatus]|uniref:Uncharacterized protein n=1 Tax=Cylicocyclus nassatus TaxID=53992 RepID=A0AA36GQS7_CYLNA|nr:unnamed protein product [Cylicocyclus nassatus]